MKPSIRLLSMLAAMLLLLAACSSADEAGQSTEEETSEPTVEETSEPMVEEESEPMDEPTEDAGTTTDENPTVAEIAATNPSFGTLRQALDAAGLTAALEESGPFTVFAPNDEAFTTLDQDQLTDLLANPDELGQILQYHVVEGEVLSSDLTDGQTVTTLEGTELTISIDGDTVMVNDATVIEPDVQAANGVIHVIDGVLTP